MNDSRSRLLFVLHDELMSGATIALLRLVEPLRERGWQPVFWVPRPGPAADWLGSRGYRVGGRWRPIASSLVALHQPPGLARRTAGTPPYLSAFRRFVRECSPALVHANSLYSFAEGIVARCMGVPTILHLHDMVPASWKAEPVRQMTRHLFHGCVAVSEACALSYATGGWKPDVVLGAAPIPVKPVATRRKPSPFVVGTVGVISKRKGSDLFVAAAEALARSDIEFRMIGSPSEPLDEGWAKDVLGRASAAGVTHLQQADVAREMETWDAVALPSRRDPFPLVMLEAMAAGLPVIGARVDGIPEQIGTDGGILIDAGDASALAGAIAQVSELSQSARAAMGVAARARAIANFTIERQATEMDHVYKRVVP